MRLFLFSAILLLLSVASHAQLVQSGDAGAAFAVSMSAEKCSDPNVAAVYVCSGNVVEVVSSVPGEGSTFYKPDGRIIACPAVAPVDMGAECVQLLGPNLCNNQSVCPQTQENAQPPAPPQQPPQAAENNTKPPPAQQVEPPVPQQNQSAPNQTITTIIPKTTAQAPGNQDLLVFAVIIGGMIILAILHYMYMKGKGSEL